jgi:two-component system chemotaxis sensor kinase CheA
MDAELLQEFVAEALELAAEVEDKLLALEQHPEDTDILNAVFRAFHTIKGSAGFMNLSAVVAACHLTENLFDALRQGSAPVTPQAVDVALRASGFVADQLAALADGTPEDQLPAMPVALEADLNEAIAGVGHETGPGVEAAATHAQDASAAAPKSGEIDWLAYYQSLLPSGQAQAAQHEAAKDEDWGWFDETGGAVQTETQPVPVTEVRTRDGRSGGDRRSHDRRSGLDDRRGEPAQVAEARAPEAQQPAGAKEESLRVRADKLDALLEVAGESVQAANQAAALLEKLMLFRQEDAAGPLMAALAETLQRASRYTTELHRATLATRMQPVGRLFQRFPRLVRELARDLDKQVDLVIEGAETEVDRVVVDSLYDPLVHMLRNSLDHGVETADARLAAGKPVKARISLRAWQEASSVVIEIADDGVGMDPQRLRRKALAMGLIGEHEALTDEEALHLVFLPGLSTKDQASSVSGRGVGMDVVKTTVEKHRGTIRIASELGHGTCFSIRLPIELSIVPTMLVSAGEVLVGMPMSAVERVIELPDELLSVSGLPVVRDQGRPLPLRSLAGVLGYESREERLGIVVASPKPYILGVCAVEGTADLVIKPMTAMPARGIAGTARSAEGSLVLILDVAFLLAGGR